MPTVEIYTKATCPYCDRAKNLLTQKNITFTEIRIDADPTKLTEMLARSEGRRTVPQIFIDGKGIGGSDDLAALAAKGELNY